MKKKVIAISLVYYIISLTNVLLTLLYNENISISDYTGWCSIISVVNMLFTYFIMVDNESSLIHYNFPQYIKVLLRNRIFIINNIMLVISFSIFVSVKFNFNLLYFIISYTLSSFYLLALCFILFQSTSKWKTVLYSIFLFLWYIFMILIILKNAYNVDFNYYQNYNPLGGTFYIMLIDNKTSFFIGFSHLVTMAIILSMFYKGKLKLSKIS